MTLRPKDKREDFSGGRYDRMRQPCCNVGRRSVGDGKVGRSLEAAPHKSTLWLNREPLSRSIDQMW